MFLLEKFIMLLLPYHKYAFIFNSSWPVKPLKFLEGIPVSCIDSFNGILWLNYECFRVFWLFSLSHISYYNTVLFAPVSTRDHYSDSHLFSVENWSMSTGTLVWLRWIIKIKIYL